MTIRELMRKLNRIGADHGDDLEVLVSVEYTDAVGHNELIDADVEFVRIGPLGNQDLVRCLVLTSSEA